MNELMKSSSRDRHHTHFSMVSAVECPSLRGLRLINNERDGAHSNDSNDAATKVVRTTEDGSITSFFHLQAGRELSFFFTR